jgi:probable lipoprotein NlpC
MLQSMMRAFTISVLLIAAGCSASGLPATGTSGPVAPPTGEASGPEAPPTGEASGPVAPPTGEASGPVPKGHESRTSGASSAQLGVMPPPTAPTLSPFHARFAEAALGFLAAGSLQTRSGRRAMNCTGLVQACFDALGCGDRPRGNTRTLHAWCVSTDRMVEVPAAGDLVFFDDTWDRDRDGQRNDPLTHVGVVVEAAPGGRVRFVHVGSRKLKDGHLDPARPGDKRDEDGGIVNSPLRVRRRRDPQGTRYLAGQLLRGFCRPPPCGAAPPTSGEPPRSGPE